MTTSVYGWRWPRYLLQPSFFLRKWTTLAWRPWATISPSTEAPATVGLPTLASPSPPTSSASKDSFLPTSPSRSSTRSLSPWETRYCLPPVWITAYIETLLREKPSECTRESPPARTRAIGAGLPEGRFYTIAPPILSRKPGGYPRAPVPNGAGRVSLCSGRRAALAAGTSRGRARHPDPLVG